MSSPKNIFVTGATGKQGGAVTRNLVKSGYKVTALSRFPQTLRALKLKEYDVDIVQGDLGHPDSYRKYLKGKYGVFSVQTFEHGIRAEIFHGKKLADEAVKAGVSHFVYSSVSGANLKSHVPHFDSKFVIESYLKTLDLPLSIIRPSSFFENFLNPAITERLEKGKLVLPTRPDYKQEYTGVNDIGIVVTQMFNQPNNYLDKTVTLATDRKSLYEIAELFTLALGKKITYQKLPLFITRLVMGKKLYKMFKWVNKAQPRLVDNIPNLREEFSGLSTLEEWINQEFGQENKIKEVTAKT